MICGTNSERRECITMRYIVKIRCKCKICMYARHEPTDRTAATKKTIQNKFALGLRLDENVQNKITSVT